MNMHLHGHQEEGTTTTPFDMVVLNELDRFHLVQDVLSRVPTLRGGTANAQQTLRDKLAEHTQYVAEYGQDLPEVRNWAWSH